MKNKALESFTTDELLGEIVRRRNAEEDREPIIPCDDCIHFLTVEPDKVIPKNWVCCGKRHKQSFRLPTSETDTNWGFYKRVCPDRTLAEV